MAVKFNRGIVKQVLVEADGVDVLVSAGCANPECENCKGAPEAWLKVIPTNHPIVTGMYARWLGDLAWFHPVEKMRGFLGALTRGKKVARQDKGFEVERIGRYRLVGEDGKRKPAPARGRCGGSPTAADLAAQWAADAYTGPEHRKGPEDGPAAPSNS